MLNRRFQVLFITLGIAVPSIALAQDRIDLLLHNGKIFSADELLSTYSSIAVDDSVTKS